MSILEKLWRGKLHLAERRVQEGSEYDLLRKELLEKDKLVTAELSPEGKKLLRECEEIQNRMYSISEEDIFIRAFRIGMGVILEVIGDYEGQFAPYCEE